MIVSATTLSHSIQKRDQLTFDVFNKNSSTKQQQQCLLSATSGHFETECELTPWLFHLYIMEMDTSDVTSCDVRGDRGIPLFVVTSCVGSQFSPRRGYKRRKGERSISPMEVERSIWCDKGYAIYRARTKCCNRVYHQGCRVRYMWGRPSFETFCPHCKTINLGEPYMLPLEWYEHNLKSKL